MDSKRIDSSVGLTVGQGDAGKWEWRINRLKEDGTPGELLGAEQGYDTETEAHQAGQVACGLLGASAA